MTKLLPNIHPGEILREEFLKPMGISQYMIAKKIGAAQIAISEIVREKRSISAQMGLKLDKFFGMSEGFFYGLQSDYNIFEAKEDLADTLDDIETFEFA